ELHRSRREYEAQVQQAYFDIRDQYLRTETAARILKMYREGLIPQAAGTFKAGVAAYEANRQDFETLLASFLDVLHLDEEYWRTLRPATPRTVWARRRPRRLPRPLWCQCSLRLNACKASG